MGFWDTVLTMTEVIRDGIDVFSDGLYSKYSDDELWAALKDKETFSDEERNVMKNALRHRGYDI